MKRDVQEYFIAQQKQYNDMLKLADKVNEEISQGLVSAEQRANFEQYFATITNNYKRVAYIYHLLCLPPKPIRAIKEYFIKRSNEKLLKKMEGSLEEVTAENNEALKNLEDTIDEVEDGRSE